MTALLEYLDLLQCIESMAVVLSRARAYDYGDTVLDHFSAA